MEREGSHAVSMQALAAEAGVSVGLIYRYVGGKDDILLAVIVNVLDDLVPVAVDHLAVAAEGCGESADRVVTGRRDRRRYGGRSCRRTCGFDEYVRQQFALALHGIVAPKQKRRHAALLEG